MTEETKPTETDRTTATLTITVAGETRTFTGETTTNGNAYRAAQQLVNAVRGDADEWLGGQTWGNPRQPR